MTDLKFYEGLRDKAIELQHIHKALDTQLGQDPEVYFILYENKIVLEIRNLKALSKLRKAVKTIYPKWQDKITTVWGSANPDYMITSWESEKYPIIHLWFECPVRTYPKSLLKPGCKIVTEKRTENYSSMVCETN